MRVLQIFVCSHLATLELSSVNRFCEIFVLWGCFVVDSAEHKINRISCL